MSVIQIYDLTSSKSMTSPITGMSFFLADTLIKKDIYIDTDVYTLLITPGVSSVMFVSRAISDINNLFITAVELL